MPAGCAVLELRVAELPRLFNAMDPAPFRERDLDPKAEEFIVEWAREVQADRPLGLVVQLDRLAGTPDEATLAEESIRQFFRGRALATRRQLRRLLRLGRTSLLISLVFLGAAIALGDLVARLVGEDRYTPGLVREGFLIGGWVAMWRPLEIFLYDWWPIRAEARLLDRLAALHVQLADGRAATTPPPG
jgi:hypothetical protein